MLASSVAERGVTAGVASDRGFSVRKPMVLAGLSAAVVAAVLFALAWQFALGPLNQASDVALGRRAQLFWDLRISGDVLGAYNHMMEAYRRRVDATGFARTGGGLVQWTGAQVKGVTLDDKGGLVDIELRYRLRKAGLSDTESTSMIRERWILENGRWHRWPPEMGG